MKISTKGRYGLRVMIELAIRHGQRPVMMDTIFSCVGVSRKYLYTLLTVLKNAGMVRAVRGAGGGFSLARAPEKITVLEVVEALEGKLMAVACVNEEDGQECERIGQCAARDVWLELASQVRKVLGNIKLDELAERQQSNQPQPLMFHI